MDVVTDLKENIADPLVESVMTIPSSLTDAVTTKEGATSVGWALAGLVGASLVGTGLTMIPMQRIPMVGNLLRVAVTGGMGIAMMNVGNKNMSGAGSAWFVGGAILTGVAAGQVLGLVGLFPRLGTMMTKQAESGYYGDMSLDNYAPLDSVEVDRSSYQPTQDYGAETIEQQMTEGTPQVEIAQEMVGNNLDSVRQEAAMGHGVTQWFGAENMNSATSFNKRMDMKKFAASTDVNGNRTRTGDDSMANVVGGTSMADSAPAMTAYDVSMEAGILPQTKELGGGVQDVFDTYILPSYEMPSAGSSGHGVTQWYAESNQTGFIGNFVAGAEGHGSVLGQ
tara:strand:+ start:3006 stop:4016 length:1011 start_codon:yes stop_codon:yes gene_type:complete